MSEDMKSVNMNRPPSATTSRISVTGRRDYGVKFIGGIDEIGGSTTNVDSNTQAPVNPSREVVSAYQPPPPWERRAEADVQDSEDEDEGCHPFWTGWLDILKGMGLILAGVFNIPLVIGHGIAKTLHYIPTLYHDDTVRRWPKITGFPSACAASGEVLWFGLFDGLTDWITLPYKGGKKEGAKGFFKGIGKGVGSFIFKLSAGGIGFATHPFFGIYKEAAKFKVVIKRKQRPRRDVGSLI
ncbi:hypothetical protein F4818DRAFT_436545 [Hypoxylon cercidicola]|nr:hypothetical protein F4818DRAFT_436545 [Hypoxylon cercidicola]